MLSARCVAAGSLASVLLTYPRLHAELRSRAPSGRDGGGFNGFSPGTKYVSAPAGSMIRGNCRRTSLAGGLITCVWGPIWKWPLAVETPKGDLADCFPRRISFDTFVYSPKLLSKLSATN